MRKTFKNNKGITLIALVITIIVLLILAGVSIATLTGNSSIIENSNKAAQAYNETVSEDDALLGNLENKLKEYIGIIDESYIGKYVNYEVPTGGDPEVKWRIFYADGMNGETVAKNDRHIYLISDDYLKYEYVPTKNNIGMIKHDEYKLSFDEIYKEYSNNKCSENITDTRIKKWIKYVDQYPDSTNINISSVAYMLDTEIWNTKYKNNYADYTIGGPTIEMFNASYKATHPEKYIEEKITDENGYKVKWNTDSEYTTSVWSNELSGLENLYVINNTIKAYSYWLASPCSNGNERLLRVNCGGHVNYDYYKSGTRGLRAIICLSANTQLVPNENGTYDLK